MEKQVNFSVSANIALRAGLADVRYRTTDGRFILSDKDLQRVRLTADEFVNGLDVIRLTDAEARALIEVSGHVLGFTAAEQVIANSTENEEVEEQSDVVEEGPEEDTPSEPTAEIVIDDTPAEEPETEETPEEEEPVEETPEEETTNEEEE